MNRTGTIFMGLCLVLLCTFGTTAVFAFDADQLETKVDSSLTDFNKIVTNSSDVLAAADGALICPKISKVGLGVGLERGTCALQVDGKTVEYWRASAASFGLTAGLQSNEMVMAFMTPEALDKFRKSKRGFEVGVTGSVAVMKTGAGSSVNTNDIKDPIVAWVYGQKGLMADLSLEGSTYKKLGTAEGAEEYGDPIQRFVATADLSDRSNDPTAQLTIDIECWVTEDQRATLQGILEEKGSQGLRDTLAEWPDCGTVKQPGGNTSIDYAYWVKLDDDHYRVILGSTEPMAFLNPRKQASNIAENVTVIQLDLNKDRVGTGVIQMGAEIGWDEHVTITSDQRTPPVKLSSVSYKKLD